MSINSHSNVSQENLERMKLQKAIKLHPELERLINGQNDTEKFIEEVNESMNAMRDEIEDMKKQHDALTQTVVNACVSMKLFEDVKNEQSDNTKELNLRIDEVELQCFDVNEAHKALDDDYKLLKNALTSTVTKQVDIGNRKVFLKKKEPAK